MIQLELRIPCQRWNRRRDSYRPAGEPIDPRRYSVEVVEEAAARRFVVEHHYAGTFPAARLSVGLHRAGVGLVGVAVFSVPMQPKSVTRHAGQDPAAGVELGRFVLLDEEPANAETWMLARAFRLLRAAKPDVRAVVSYSDPLPRVSESGHEIKPGHVGTIYRAFNGRFVGRSSPRVLVLARDGRVVSGRTLTKLRKGERGAAAAYRTLLDMGAPRRLPGEADDAYVSRALRDGPFRRMPHPGNLAYAWGLDDDARAALPDRLPFPAAV
jgi:hypothetical protein